MGATAQAQDTTEVRDRPSIGQTRLVGQGTAANLACNGSHREDFVCLFSAPQRRKDACSGGRTEWKAASSQQGRRTLGLEVEVLEQSPSLRQKDRVEEEGRGQGLGVHREMPGCGAKEGRKFNLKGPLQGQEVMRKSCSRALFVPGR